MRLYVRNPSQQWRTRTAAALPPVSTRQLVYSSSPSRTDPQPLDGAVLGGAVHIFLDVPGSLGITQVRFFLDGTQIAIENFWPFDFAGGTSAGANPANLTPGDHTIQAQVDEDGQTIATQAYTVTVPTTTPPTPPAGFTTDGFSYILEEVPLWNARSSAGPYLFDWTRINSNSTAWLANPSHWDGSGLTTSGGIVVSGNPPPAIVHTQMRDAAFRALVKSDATARTTVKTQLLAQMNEPLLDFSDRTRWALGNIGGATPAVQLADVLTKLLLTYDYAHEAFTTAEQVEAEAWFVEAALWASSQYDVTFNALWGGGTNRVTGTYVGNTGNFDDILYFGGPRANLAAVTYNARRAGLVRFVGMAAALTGDSTLRSNFTLAAKEYIMFTVYPQGAMGDFFRWIPENADNGWDFANQCIGALCSGAYHLARAGYRDLFDFTTSLGTSGTEGTAGGPKSILFAMESQVGYLDGTFTRFGTDLASQASGTTYKIDGQHGSWDAPSEIYVAPANRYYRSAKVKTGYTRSGPGMRPHPAPGTEAPAVPLNPQGLIWNGDGGIYPGVLFMHGQMEDTVPFNRLFPSAPTGVEEPE